MPLKIAIASDHAGFQLKSRLAAYLKSIHHDVLDLGTHSEDRVDYPDFGYKLAETVLGGGVLGIGICGSGIGIDIALNRFAGIRSALCTSPEMARLGRLHNDANVLSLGARLTDENMAMACVDAFLSTDFEGGRHQGRVEKLSSCGVTR
jgi:ribose 5-phosphate isomerase B